MLHTVLSKVQVGRILGKAQDSVKSLTHGTLSVLTKKTPMPQLQQKINVLLGEWGNSRPTGEKGEIF